MDIRLMYFASLRESLGQREEQLSLPAGVVTVGALRAHLAARGETWQRLAPGHNVRAAVNQTMAGDEAAIAAGDEVAFFPPVTGG
jgi:molybdopterin synthase sulfur carrier subunit